MATLSLDELCEQTGLTARTVRYYQASGLLQRPARAGRNAVYSDEHVQRVRQIAEMRARGLKLDAIRDVLHARAIGKAPVVALLGPELSSDQWLTQSSATLTAVEVAELLGERYLDMLADLEKAGYLRKVSTEAGTRWQADDLPLLRGALQLAEIGTDVALSAQARDRQRHAAAVPAIGAGFGPHHLTNGRIADRQQQRAFGDGDAFQSLRLIRMEHKRDLR